MAAFNQVCQPANSLPVDPLCCHEEDLSAFWEEEVDLDQCSAEDRPTTAAEEAAGRAHWVWDEGGGDQEEDTELAAFLSKEAKAHFATKLSAGHPDADPSLSWVRLDAVRWLLKACARHGFTAQTALLAVDYLDRFLSSTRCGGAGGAQQQQQPWMAQLLAVACLSLAAKMEETHVPLLLDLQVEEARYVFESRTVRRMELLVLSTLGWRMGAPTPLSFIDHFLRRRRSFAAETARPLSSSSSSPPRSHCPTDSNTANKNESDHLQRGYAHLQYWKFQARCHSILLAIIADSRWVHFLPSVLAAGTMLHALTQLLDQHPSASSTMNSQNNIMNLLNVTKDQVQACAQFILDATGNGNYCSNDGGGHGGATGNKRKQAHASPPSSLPPRSPRGVMEAALSYDSCSDSRPASTSTSASSSPDMPPPRALKRLRSIAAVGRDGGEQCCPRPLLGGVFV